MNFKPISQCSLLYSDQLLMIQIKRNTYSMLRLLIWNICQQIIFGEPRYLKMHRKIFTSRSCGKFEIRIWYLNILHYSNNFITIIGIQSISVLSNLEIVSVSLYSFVSVLSGSLLITLSIFDEERSSNICFLIPYGKFTFFCLFDLFFLETLKSVTYGKFF